MLVAREELSVAGLAGKGRVDVSQLRRERLKLFGIEGGV